MIKDPRNVIILALVALVFFLVLIASGTLSMAQGQQAKRAVKPVVQKIVPPAEVAPTTPATTTTQATQ